MAKKAQERYFGEIVKLKDGRFKVKFMDKLVPLNQYRRVWKNINAREFSRTLNNSSLVIN